MSNPVISGHDFCFDRTGQGGSTSKNEMRSVKMVQNAEGSSLTLRRKKLSVKKLFLFFYPAFVAKGCVDYTKPDTVLL